MMLIKALRTFGRSKKLVKSDSLDVSDNSECCAVESLIWESAWLPSNDGVNNFEEDCAGLE